MGRENVKKNPKVFEEGMADTWWQTPCVKHTKKFFTKDEIENLISDISIKHTKLITKL